MPQRSSTIAPRRVSSDVFSPVAPRALQTFPAVRRARWAARFSGEARLPAVFPGSPAHVASASAAASRGEARLEPAAVSRELLRNSSEAGWQRPSLRSCIPLPPRPARILLELCLTVSPRKALEAGRAGGGEGASKGGRTSLCVRKCFEIHWGRALEPGITGESREETAAPRPRRLAGPAGKGRACCVAAWRWGCPARRTRLRSAPSVFLGPRVTVCRGDSSMRGPRCEKRASLWWFGMGGGMAAGRHGDLSSSAHPPGTSWLCTDWSLSSVHVPPCARPRSPRLCVCESVGRVWPCARFLGWAQGAAP